MLDHANICWTVDSLRDGARLRARPARASCRTSRWRTSPSASPRTTAGIAFALRGHDLRRHPVPRRDARARHEPQMLFGVPRTFEKIHSAVQAVLAADPGQRRGVRAGARGRRARRRAPRRAARTLSADLAARVRARSTPRSLRPVRQLLGLDDAAGRGDRGGADPGRDPAVLPRAGRAALGDLRHVGVDRAR